MDTLVCIALVVLIRIRRYITHEMTEPARRLVVTSHPCRHAAGSWGKAELLDIKRKLYKVIL